MSLTFGFYNSLNGDRKYDTVQISSIFDGIIVDGVFASVGTAFVVKAAGGNTLNVGTGRAWFDHTWTLNDAVLPVEAFESELLLDRIDAIVLEINATETVRANSIKFIQGTPSSSPVRPTLTNEELVHQHPLCYIYRTAGSTEITQADITNMIGSEETPFVTGILQTISLDELLGQWQSELDQFVDNESAEVDEFIEQMKTDLTAEQQYVDEWIASEQADFNTWFENLETQLSGDVAANLQVQIDQVKREIQSNIVYITLYADKWVGIDSFTQTVEVNGATADSKIDLQPDVNIIKQLLDDEVVALYVENNEGVLTVYSIDGKPSVDLTVQATITDTYIDTNSDT